MPLKKQVSFYQSTGHMAVVHSNGTPRGLVCKQGVGERLLHNHVKIKDLCKTGYNMQYAQDLGCCFYPNLNWSQTKQQC